jgi:hypothetical protein
VALRERSDDAALGHEDSGALVEVPAPALAPAPTATPRDASAPTRADLERANRQLLRENARLARMLPTKADAAGAAHLARLDRIANARAVAAEARVRTLEGEIAQLGALLATPRHRTVERARDSLMGSPLAYALVRRGWAACVRLGGGGRPRP